MTAERFSPRVLSVTFETKVGSECGSRNSKLAGRFQRRPGVGMTENGSGKDLLGIAVYLALFAVQVFGAIYVIAEGIPAFAELSLHVGAQPREIPYDNYTTIFVLFSMQAAYWHRFRSVEIPFRTPNVLLNHLFLFLGCVSFIFGGALFSVVVFRHLPQLGGEVDRLVFARRGATLAGSLFALFCFTLELERLGAALGDRTQCGK